MVLLKDARESSDASLVDMCQDGDSSAFDELVRRYKDRIYNVAYRFLGNREDALDLSQEVFVRAYRGVDGFRGKSNVFTWLYSIAANLSRNYLRDASRKGRNMSVSLDGRTAMEAHASETPRALAEAHELDEVLQQCLDELPEHYKIAFVLRTFDDLSYEEIATALKCPKGTVKSRISEARRRLRDRLLAFEAL